MSDTVNDGMVSVVIPALNEEQMIPRLIRELRELEGNFPGGLEIVMVNDGSRDKTVEVARQELEGHRHWKIVSLSRNFGQQAAYLAGLHHATGAAVVMMDADLQDPPSLIPELVAKWEAGAKLVTAVRLSRAEKGFKRFAFDTFHKLFHWLSGGIMPRNSGNFGLMDRVIVEQIKAMRETNLYLPALRAWVGYRQSEVTYHRQPRAEGEAKQNWKRLFNLAWDAITSFSNVPLRLIGWTGFFIALTAFVYAGWLVLQRILQGFGWFKDLEVLGFTTLAVAVMGLGGVQLLCLGIIGEYLGRLYREAKGRPPFVVERVEMQGVPDGEDSSGT
jgi:dolichol-phosphate mannosyltransferase